MFRNETQIEFRGQILELKHILGLLSGIESDDS
jgi:hypothetical protein